MPASETQRKGSELRRQLMGEGFADRINQTVCARAGQKTS